ncbi:MAG: CoA transferase [Variibacter sp.]|nr:CoA transferase [Variibacter sp.]
MGGPLAGLKVVDVSIMAAGPWVGSLLGMMGAEVIKIEPPAGDGTRWVAPRQRGMGTNFICLNVNKRDVILDFKSEDDLRVTRELVRQADVFIQNFRGGVIERLGLGWDVLKTINPKLVYCSISGFGEEGPLRKAGSADYVMQAFSGFAALNGPEGRDVPEQFRFSGFIDLTTSSVAVEAVLAALLSRVQTGEGQKIELSMLEAALEMQATRLAGLLLAGAPPVPMGCRSAILAPDRAFRTMDRDVFVTCRSDAEFHALVAALKLPELAEDPRFASNAARVANVAALDAALEPAFLTGSALWWLRRLRRDGIPAAVALDFETFRHHAQVTANGMIAELDTEDWGHVAVAGPPWRFGRTPGGVVPPARPGEDTEAICGPIRRGQVAPPAERAS